MGHFLFLWSTSDIPGPVANPPAGHRITLLDQYEFDDLADTGLMAFDGLIVSMHADQRHLMQHQQRLDHFVEQRSLMVNGPVAHCFLPEFTAAYVPLPKRGLREMAVTVLDRSDIFAGINNDDLTYQRGVAGFWGRGVQAHPQNARILTALGEDRTPFDWSIIRPGGGRLLVHPGNDLWTFCDGTKSSNRAWPQALDWLVAGQKRARS